MSQIQYVKQGNHNAGGKLLVYLFSRRGERIEVVADASLLLLPVVPSQSKYPDSCEHQIGFLSTSNKLPLLLNGNRQDGLGCS